MAFESSAAAQHVTSSASLPFFLVTAHVGAGYHSFKNERSHRKVVLAACDTASRRLRNNGLATAAAVAGVQRMEDSPLTNAGYGSNLTECGVVEGDALIMDHHGRSGAVSAVLLIKNPIVAAAAVYEQSNRGLSCCRLAPNLLAGSGALAFARSQGQAQVQVLPALAAAVSADAAERWAGWSQDLAAAAAASARAPAPSLPRALLAAHSASLLEYAAVTNDRLQHLDSMLSVFVASAPATAANVPAAAAPATSPEASPCGTIPEMVDGSQRGSPPRRCRPSRPRAKSLPRLAAEKVAQAARRFPAAPAIRPTLPSSVPTPLELGEALIPLRYLQLVDSLGVTIQVEIFPAAAAPATPAPAPPAAASSDGKSQFPLRAESGNIMASASGSAVAPAPVTTPASFVSAAGRSCYRVTVLYVDDDVSDADEVNDTVGIITMDKQGRLAAGSSSGGLGIKLSGRVGPAALVGAGCAIVPADPEDPDETRVAVVGSGTGEYMTTSHACVLAAERLYHSQKKVAGGKLLPCDEQEVLRNFVRKEFLGHASIAHRGNTRQDPVIGLLAVKATKTSVKVYTAHNSASFCYGSQAIWDSYAKTIMSRRHIDSSNNIAVSMRVFDL